MNSPEPQVPQELTILYAQKGDGTWEAEIPELLTSAHGPNKEQARAAALHEAATDMMAYSKHVKERVLPSPDGTASAFETIQLFLMAEGAACSSAVYAIVAAAPILAQPIEGDVPVTDEAVREKLADARKNLQYARDRVHASVLDLDRLLGDAEERDNLEIYVINDGHHHWYAAPSATAALQLAIRTGQIDGDAPAVSAEQVTEKEAIGITIDDDGTKRTLWEMFQRQAENKEPGLLGSSVY